MTIRIGINLAGDKFAGLFMIFEMLKQNICRSNWKPAKGSWIADAIIFTFLPKSGTYCFKKYASCTRPTIVWHRWDAFHPIIQYMHYDKTQHQQIRFLDFKGTSLTQVVRKVVKTHFSQKFILFYGWRIPASAARIQVEWSAVACCCSVWSSNQLFE